MKGDSGDEQGAVLRGTLYPVVCGGTVALTLCRLFYSFSPPSLHILFAYSVATTDLFLE